MTARRRPAEHPGDREVVHLKRLATAVCSAHPSGRLTVKGVDIRQAAWFGVGQVSPLLKRAIETLEEGIRQRLHPPATGVRLGRIASPGPPSVLVARPLVVTSSRSGPGSTGNSPGPLSGPPAGSA